LRFRQVLDPSRDRQGAEIFLAKARGSVVYAEIVHLNAIAMDDFSRLPHKIDKSA